MNDPRMPVAIIATDTLGASVGICRAPEFATLSIVEGDDGGSIILTPTTARAIIIAVGAWLNEQEKPKRSRHD